MALPNFQRFFAEVVSVEAWHNSFNGQRLEADLHADVVFRQARLGAEPDSPVRFRLGIKRAEVILRISPNEPLEVLPNSISRDDPLGNGRLKITVENMSKKEAGIGGSAGIGQGKSGVSVDARKSSTASSGHHLELESSSNGVSVLQSRTPDGDYRWELTPLAGDILQGRGWDAVAQPRGTLRDTRSGSKSLPPTARIEVICAKEDLSITDVSLKDGVKMNSVRSAFGFDNRRAAAEAYIRTKLVELGLSLTEFEDPFSQFSIADVMARAVD